MIRATNCCLTAENKTFKKTTVSQWHPSTQLPKLSNNIREKHIILQWQLQGKVQSTQVTWTKEADESSPWLLKHKTTWGITVSPDQTDFQAHILLLCMVWLIKCISNGITAQINPYLCPITTELCQLLYFNIIYCNNKKYITLQRVPVKNKNK